MMQRAVFSGISINIPSDWAEVTSSLEGPTAAPITLRRTTGDGTLQLSTAPWGPAGPKPDLSPDDLAKMVARIAERQGLYGAFDQRTSSGRFLIAAASYKALQIFLRVWCISDGKTVVFATYSSPFGPHGGDVVMCEAMLDTMEFPEGE